MKTSVSVIVPVYNSGRELVPHIESLLGQSLKDIEIIIVNDGSSDNTGEIIENLANEHTNIVAVHLDKNKGVHEARLAGLKKSSAPWIGFMDADDFVRPNMYSTMLAAGEKYNTDIVICSTERVDENRKFVRLKLNFKKSRKVEKSIFVKFCRFEFGTGMLCNKLYKRHVIQPYFNLYYPWRQTMNEDLLLNIGCFSQAKSVYLLKDVLYDYVVNNTSVTSTTNSSDAYVEHFRAFALAVSIFPTLSQEFKNNIINMYRTQLSRSEYHVLDLNDIIKYDEKLIEAINVIYDSNPLALALLSAHKPLPLVGARLAAKSIYYRCVSKMGLNLNPY